MDANNKNNNVDDEQREATEASMLLHTMKYEKISDAKVAQELEKQKKETQDMFERAGLVQHNPVPNPQPTSMEIQQQQQQGEEEADHYEHGFVSHEELPPIPALHGLIGECSKPLEKQLTESDIKDDQSRLALNKEFVTNNFLQLLDKSKDENVDKGITVVTYDSEGRQYDEMVFKLWAEKMYVLTRSWKKFRQDHNFVKQIDFVTVWLFRHQLTRQLCFAITSRRDNNATSPERKSRSNGNGNWKNRNGNGNGRSHATQRTSSV